MRATPYLLIVLGVVFLLYALFNFAIGVTSEALEGSIAGAVNAAAERMTDEELERVFNIQDRKNMEERREALHLYFGGTYAPGYRNVQIINMFASLVLGLWFIVWGFLEPGRPQDPSTGGGGDAE